MRNQTKLDQAALTSSEGRFMYVLMAGAPEEAADAVERVASDPSRRSKAAHAITEEYFHPEKVLTLIEGAQGSWQRL
jgi:hypothetical protein